MTLTEQMLTATRRGLPHGGQLVDRRLDTDQATELAASGLPWLPLSAAEAADLQALVTGAYSPLTGFMGANNTSRWSSRCGYRMGTLWPIPICLGLPEELRVGSGRVLLRDADGGLAGVVGGPGGVPARPPGRGRAGV